ncbi:MAG: hypothetical protein PHE51_10660 [Eubacteriales bacterium]|nr:hypothetical protein [Eubacteriales bacterium]
MITIWDIFKYIFKWKSVIAIIVAVAVVFSYWRVNTNQIYNATVIIQLNNSSISKGNAPDGSKYDYYEIASPNVLTEVVRELGLKTGIDALRTKITVSPIIPQTEKEIQESKEKSGEKHEYYPNTFSITYAGRVGESSGTIREILESVIDNYMEFYNTKYSDKASINDTAYSEEMGSFDYIEKADMLSQNVYDIMQTLEGLSSADPSFRSSSTGYTFKDISNKYKYLRDFSIPEVYSDIYSGQITKDKSLLIKTYTQEKEDYLLQRKNFLEEAELAKTRMESFSLANKNVPNAYNNNTRNNSDNIEMIEDINASRNVNEETTYDHFMRSYVDASIAANNLLLKAEDCDNIIAKFTAKVNVKEQETIEENVDNKLNEIFVTMNDLNKEAMMVIQDYNDYNEASHISPLTGVNCYPTMSVMLYMLLAAFVSGFFSIILAISVEVFKKIKRENRGSL